MEFFGFHPLIAEWFRSRFNAPTEPQQLGWPHIAAGEHTLIAAPTGSGKTLTAFLACIDRLLKRALAGELRDEVSVVYVSPLRALSNDMHRNLEQPLAEILAKAGVGGQDSGFGAEEEDAGAGGQDSGFGATPPAPFALNPDSRILTPSSLRVGLRTGDTSPAQRAKLVRKPPHILVTTPESLYLMLTAARSRETLKNVETIIIDEIHALVRDKRGSHLSLTVERLEALVGRPLQRIGLSATQKPIERVARFLCGAGAGVRIQDSGFRADGEGVRIQGSGFGADGEGVRIQDSGFGAEEEEAGDRSQESGARHTCATPSALKAESRFLTPASSAPTSESRILTPASSALNPESRPPTPASCAIVNVGHARTLDLAIEVPPSDLGAVCMHEQWAEVHARLVELVQSHRSTLIFVNTRRLAERLTHELTGLLGDGAVGSHHGSLSAEMRLGVERRLKAGEIKAVVATASLELGIDVGYIDLVVQIGSPRAIATFLQRIGRSGHSLGLIPKGRLFALTRDELLECMALMRAVRGGRLDAVAIPPAPLDVLAQQIVAEVAARECDVDELFDTFRRADPYRDLSRHEYDETVRFLAEGVPTSGGRIPAYLHFDQVNRRLRPRPGARIAAISNAGAIPEIGSYRVVTEGEQTVVGTVDEEFAVESNRGDVFLLGNNSWRILHVRGSDVTVADAHGAPPTIPFWQGEAPGRTIELSEEVASLREEFERRLDDRPALEAWLPEETAVPKVAVGPIIDYVAAQRGALGLLPTTKHVIFERFFDETGGMQLVVHAPFGAGVTRAWGFAMRKRFCRSFDFELQATADDDGFILSVGPQHSFPIESLFPMLTRANARSLLEQAVLRIPVYQIRFRWAASRALLVLRRKNGQKVPPALQRFRADDALSAIFPRLTGCQEHNHGEIELPDHPLARQTMEDCLHEYMDLDGLHEVLERIERGEITLIARDTREPSPFCYELLNSNPYAFLDGGEVQERRARAVQTRRSLTVESVSDLARLDPEAIAQVRREAQPLVRNADELHDVLLSRIVLPVFVEGGTEGRSDGATERQRDGETERGTEGRAEGRSVGGVERRSNGETEGPTAPSAAFGAQAEWLPLYAELERTRRAATMVLPDGRRAWVAAERWPAARAVFPEAVAAPALTVPAGIALDPDPIECRVAMIRGLMEVCGPITSDRVATELAITTSQADAALEALEGEGAVLRGRFENTAPPVVTQTQPLGAKTATGAPGDSLSTLAGSRCLSGCAGEGERQREPASDVGDHGGAPVAAALAVASAAPPAHLPSTLVPRPSTSPEWCHRRLLARIHRLTMEGLRKQIEPVSPETFLRFLLRQHGLAGDNRRNGTNGLYETVSMLQGVDVPAAAWESDLLSPRLDNYQPAWLDELCLSGEIGWGRLFPPQNGKGRPGTNLTRVVPVSLWLRSDLEWLLARQGEASADELSGAATDLFALLQSRGALFAGDLLAASRMLPSHLRDALGELVARGLVTADAYSGLRDLLGDRLDPDRGASRQRDMGAVRKRVTPRGAGRWALWRRPALPADANEEARRHVVEQWAWQLLRRWGVVFKDLLEREEGAPSWFELLQVFRRYEARGELRGGRFIAGVAGEQFALGDTVRLLRQLRDEKPPRELVVLSAADPLNLVGVVTAHPRVPRTAGNRVAFIDGVPVAALQGGEALQLRPLAGDWPLIVTRALNGPVGLVKTTPRPGTNGDCKPPGGTTTNGATTTGPSANGRPAPRKPSASKKRPAAAAPNDIPRPPHWG